MVLWKDWFGGDRSGRQVPEELHEAIITQALNPMFYGPELFQDTFAGRFENATIHAMLLFRRLRDSNETGDALAQEVFGELFSGFDDALREVGTGDLKVGKKIKDLAKAFYGRAEAYDAALNETASKDAGTDPLVDPLCRNVKLAPAGAERMARYIRTADEMLQNQADESLLKGRLSWPVTF